MLDLPALALLTRMMWLLALPSQDIPRRPTLRYPKMACGIFHMAEEHLMEQRCLRGFFGSTVTDNSDIGKGAKNLSVAYRHNWTRKQIFKTHQASLPPVRPLMEMDNVAVLLNDMKRETAFAKLNKHSKNFEHLLQALIKPPYLVPKDRLIALSSRRLAFQLRPDTQTFLNNLLRSQGLSDNPPTSDPFCMSLSLQKIRFLLRLWKYVERNGSRTFWTFSVLGRSRYLVLEKMRIEFVVSHQVQAIEALSNKKDLRYILNSRPSWSQEQPGRNSRHGFSRK